MADLTESALWTPGIYQIETSDPVLGGPEGVDNLQGKQLANRTVWLKQRINNVESGDSIAGKAAMLATARSISITGDASWSVSFNGGDSVTAALSLANSGVAPGSYAKITVNAKGIVTAGAALMAADIPALDWSKITTGKPASLNGYGIAVATQEQTVAGVDDNVAITPKSLAQRLAVQGATAGVLINARMYVDAEVTYSVFTADEVTVKAGSEGVWLLSSFNKGIDLTTVGAGGMDIGPAPASSFISIYAIYNPTTQATALLACDQNVSRGRRYTGANMPPGYTASGLVSAWRTTSDRRLAKGLQIDRQVNVEMTNINTSTVNQSNTPLNISAIVPLAAREISGLMQCGSSVTSNVNMALSGAVVPLGARNLGATVAGGTVVQGGFSGLSIGTPGVVYYTANAYSGALSSTAYLTSYTI